ncbi:MAG TPA: cation:proton antiporter [Cyclobacteriaceae bacterium]|nr:cation:proton antiporter [Cyclobacteriaceae bacterium]
MKRSAGIWYVVIFILFVASIIWLLFIGKNLEPTGVVNSPSSGSVSASDHFLESFTAPLPILIIQIITIILVARAIGFLTGRIGQPLVVGEIIAGILLGPSFLGLIFPEFSSFLFPASSVINLQFLSQIGLILFMFIIGMELDVKVLKNQASAAVVVSHASILFPYFMGVVLAYFIYTEFAPDGVSFAAFALFLGIAMSITAFPVLARIIQERGLSKTPLGTMAITCAAADDVSAWCILAAVVAFVKAGNAISALYTLILAFVFVLFMLTFVRSLMKKIGSVYASREIFSKKVVGLVFIVLLASSYVAEIIGIHALFGAFLAGVIMPQNLAFKKIITEKIEDISLVLLLPLFFVTTGLRTEIGLLNDSASWVALLFVVLVAIVGKFGGASLASRFVGLNWRDALSVGVLMNTRGLMEIVIVNIGYDLGILSPEVFTMLVLMALITTLLTGPGLEIIDRTFSKVDFGAEVLSKIKTSFRIFISFGPSKMGSTLLRLADQLTLKHNKHISITALHITPSVDVKPYEAVLYEKEAFQPIKATAQLLGLKLETIYKNTEEVDKEIMSTVSAGNFDLVLVGAARTMFNTRATGGVLRQLLEEGETNICVLIDRGFVMAESILVLLGSEEDRSLLQYAHRFRSSNRARVTILKVGDGQSVNLHDKESSYYDLSSSFGEVIEQRIPDRQLLAHFNLIITSLSLWNEINEMRASWIKDCPSILVIKHHQDLFTDSDAKLLTERNKA